MTILHIHTCRAVLQVRLHEQAVAAAEQHARALTVAQGLTVAAEARRDAALRDARVLAVKLQALERCRNRENDVSSNTTAMYTYAYTTSDISCALTSFKSGRVVV
jgi:hypothetical protein